MLWYMLTMKVMSVHAEISSTSKWSGTSVRGGNPLYDFTIVPNTPVRNQALPVQSLASQFTVFLNYYIFSLSFVYQMVWIVLIVFLGLLKS